MAGEGKRFLNENILTPKPFLQLKDSLIFIEVLNKFKNFDQIIVITQSKYKKFISNIDHFRNTNINFIFLNSPTLGQADTVLAAEKLLLFDDNIVIAPCDGIINESISDLNLFNSDMDVWCFTGDETFKSHHQMYSWVSFNESNDLINFSAKKSISKDPYNDWALSGYFSFKSAGYLIDMIYELKKLKILLKNEYYIDSIIQLSQNNKDSVKVIKIRNFLCLGTPQQYWKYLENN